MSSLEQRKLIKISVRREIDDRTNTRRPGLNWFDCFPTLVIVGEANNRRPNRWVDIVQRIIQSCLIAHRQLISLSLSGVRLFLRRPRHKRWAPTWKAPSAEMQKESKELNRNATVWQRNAAEDASSHNDLKLLAVVSLPVSVSSFWLKKGDAHYTATQQLDWHTSLFEYLLSHSLSRRDGNSHATVNNYGPGERDRPILGNIQR